MPDNVELQIATAKNKGGRPRGMDNVPIVIDPVEFRRYQEMNLQRKGAYLREEFADVAYIVLKRAKMFAPSVSKRDFGKLTMLMSSAGIAYDKVIPKGEPLGVAIQVNLFKGLSQERIGPVLGNDAVDVTPQRGMNTDDAAS
jgi:hypothetical protein